MLIEKQKRGRKPKLDENGLPTVVNKVYFSNIQEVAVVEYLTETDKFKRDTIYNKYLKFAFEKMAESIINRYKLYSSSMSYKELFDDTISFLHTKLDKFDPTKGTKAYSYFGTIIKRHLQGNRIKETKDRNRTTLYEDVYRVVCRGGDIIDVEYNEYDPNISFFYVIVEDIKHLLEGNPEYNTLISQNQRQVGEAIIEIMEGWKTIFEDDSIKYNKNFVLECVRNMTLLSTKEITHALKFYKTIYIQRKKSFIKNENIEEEIW